MPDLTPADLARFVHPVPVGARFPMNMEFMEWLARDGYFRGPFHFPDSSRVQLADDPPRWTAEPIPAPLPPLPTAPGSIIANVSVADCPDTCAVMMREQYGDWFGRDQDGDMRMWPSPDITAWTPARIVTDEPAGDKTLALMNENDKRDRIDADGDRVTWDGEHWRYDGATRGRATLAHYAATYRPIVAFA